MAGRRSRNVTWPQTALAALASRPGLAPIGQVLSINDGGLGLDRAQMEDHLVQGRIRTRRADPDLPRHQPDRLQRQTLHFPSFLPPNALRTAGRDLTA